MIGAFISGFITGALVTFILLVIIAICSLKSKERKIKECIGGVKCNKSPFKPYVKPFKFYNKPIVLNESSLKVDYQDLNGGVAND